MTNSDWALIVLPLTAAAMHATGFVKYNLSTKDGASKPSFVSWFIWAILATMNAATFMSITSFVVGIQTFVGSLGCIGTFLYALWSGKFESPSRGETSILIVNLVAIAVWKYDSALNANLVLMVAILISFWPTFIEMWKHPEKEPALPWILWGSAYGLTTTSTFILGGVSLKLAMPILGTVAHLAVPLICKFRKN